MVQARARLIPQKEPSNHPRAVAVREWRIKNPELHKEAMRRSSEAARVRRSSPVVRLLHGQYKKNRRLSLLAQGRCPEHRYMPIGLWRRCLMCFDSDLKECYGIGVGEYFTMLSHQKGHCVFCGDSDTLNVDHNHRTGVVRGLLCHNHNVMIGWFEKCFDMREEMLKYIERW